MSHILMWSHSLILSISLSYFTTTTLKCTIKHQQQKRNVCRERLFLCCCCEWVKVNEWNYVNLYFACIRNLMISLLRAVLIQISVFQLQKKKILSPTISVELKYCNKYNNHRLQQLVVMWIFTFNFVSKKNSPILIHSIPGGYGGNGN
jgi:hypothetical protein